MTVKQLREQTRLSQTEFAKKFHINKGTLANWEQSLRHPPEHVIFMMEQILLQEEILNNIYTRITEEKQKDRSRYYSEEICTAGKNALNTALDIMEEEKKKLKDKI